MTDTTTDRPSRSFGERLFGGNPAGVILRLVIVSLLVGFVMQSFGFDVRDLVRGAVDIFRDALRDGFREFRHVGSYILTGAAVVIPVWLLLRLTRRR